MFVFSLLISSAFDTIFDTVFDTEAKQADFQESEELISRAAISDTASYKKGLFVRKISDHFGDPSQFKQYIIRIPPIHA
ncbi:MAG: hypothetical protein ACJAVI_003296 [Candidatus Azotimanducaceae bacterium]|jgi:hypothetical protein